MAVKFKTYSKGFEGCNLVTKSVGDVLNQYRNLKKKSIPCILKVGYITLDFQGSFSQFLG